MKYDNKHYYEAPRMFWTTRYEVNFDPVKKENIYKAKAEDKYQKFVNLSVYAKWLYQTLKELEHRHTGRKNNKYTAYYEGVKNTKNWFYCGIKKLSFLSQLSESTIRRARMELIKVGIIKTCKVRLIDKNGIRNPIRVTGYRVYGEIELGMIITEYDDYDD